MPLAVPTQDLDNPEEGFAIMVCLHSDVRNVRVLDSCPPKVQGTVQRADCRVLDMTEARSHSTLDITTRMGLLPAVITARPAAWT